jgi:hypothetical protein
LYQSTFGRVAISTWSQVFQGPRGSISSVLNSPIVDSANALTLLYLSTCWVGGRGEAAQGSEQGTDFAGEEPVQAADDLRFCLAFGGAPGYVGAGGFVVLHAHDDRSILSTGSRLEPSVTLPQGAGLTMVTGAPVELLTALSRPHELARGTPSRNTSRKTVSQSR